LAEFAFTETADPETLIRFTEAIEDLRRAGAIVAGDFLIPNLDSLRQGLGCSRFRYDIDTYLASVPNPPVHSLQEIEEGGRVHVTVMPRVRNFLQFEGTSDTNEGCIQACKNEELLREGVRAAMAEYNVEALVYPTWNNPPRLVGDLSNPHGNNSPILSPPTGFPAITVPMGFVWDDTLPAGLQIYGDAWSEPLLIRIAYTYEQATNHRRPPKTAPPLEG
ncbi:MAG: amidase family protein, partial [Gemmatimonadetes bacterium]|nr:amidase family protein [Gemmatimonadota bacterium]